MAHGRGDRPTDGTRPGFTTASQPLRWHTAWLDTRPGWLRPGLAAGGGWLRAGLAGGGCWNSGVDVVGDGSEHGGDLLGFSAVRVLAAVVGVREAVEQLDQIFDEHGHLVGTFPAGLRHSRRRLECPYLKGLRAPASLGYTELHALSGPQHCAGRRQGGRVHEDLTAVITGEEAESLVGVIPLDLASRHEQTLYARKSDELELAVHIQASGLGPAIIG